jgi:tetrapyrrole methylase family protein/MazG family protein
LKKKANLDDLVKLMARLRSKNGCPWDKKQTPSSLRVYIIEEAYELVEEIEKGDPDKICDELGDLLFQIIFQAQIFSERGSFSLSEVIARIYKKMQIRHPHVFGDKKCATPDAVKKQWVEIKKVTRPGSSVLGEVPAALPALLRARRITDNAAQVGFDWDRTSQVMAKFDEEREELKRALKRGKRAEIEDELGDILFVLVNLSRFLKLNPEDALKKTTRKFEKRFHYIERGAKKQGRNLRDMTLKEMDQLWDRAKKVKRLRSLKVKS